MNPSIRARTESVACPAPRHDQSGAKRSILCLWAVFFLSALTGLAQGTTTVSSVPANGATGVSVSAAVVFTFSAAMDTNTFSATFYSTSPFGSYPVVATWNAANTVLTCTPSSPFPGNVTISWVVSGQDTASNLVIGQGTFTTGTGGGGGGGGSGTNAFTSFSAGKIYFYQQLGTGAPTPYPDISYGLTTSTSLASNRSATAVTVTVPGASAPIGLTQNSLKHEDWSYLTWSTNQTMFESTYPEGDYSFNVTGTPANLQQTVTLPTTMAQPNGPHVLNFTAAQAVNASQSFALNWDPFQNGTAADAITVSVINDLGKTVFATPSPGTNGALPGTVTSVTILGGTLAASTTNTATIIFYRFVTTTNASSAIATVAYRASDTQLSLITAGSGTTAPTPVVGNPSWGSSGFGFDVQTAVNQALVIRYSTDLLTWSTLFTTNSPGTTVHIPIPIQPGANGFFRVQNGP